MFRLVDVQLLSCTNDLDGNAWSDKAAHVRSRLSSVVTISAPHHGTGLADSQLARFAEHPLGHPRGALQVLATLKDLVSIDFFTVATVRFEILFVLIILAHDRRRVRHFNITAHPTAEWTAQQVVEAFPWETAPRFLLRDRDGVYGTNFRKRVAALGIKEVLSAPRSPWPPTA